MPELPEVETITRELSHILVGKKLIKFAVFDVKKIGKPRLPAGRQGFVLPLEIVSVRRRGKFIILSFENGLRCIIHLRMTGQMRLGPERMPHERARFYFSDGSVLRFVDARRFGTIEWQTDAQSLPQPGVEPLSKDFNAKKLGELLYGRKKLIKSALLDQRLVAGLGNIYADESLWTAKIHPMRRSGALKSREIVRLVRSIKEILREAIKKGGFTLRDYRRTDGSSGYYQDSRKVYDREGEKCFRCCAKIKKIKIGGRSSYFCPKCQKEK